MASSGSPGKTSWAEATEKKFGELLAATNAKMSDLMEAARKNYDEIQKLNTPPEAKSEGLEKLKKVQADLQVKLQATKEGTMKLLDDQYKQIYSQNEYNKAKVDEFQKNMNKALGDINDRTSKYYNEAMDKFKTYQGKTMDEFSSYYTDMKGKLNAYYDDAFKKIDPKK